MKEFDLKLLKHVSLNVIFRSKQKNQVLKFKQDILENPLCCNVC